jgi:hypothetical protein
MKQFYNKYFLKTRAWHTCSLLVDTNLWSVNGGDQYINSFVTGFHNGCRRVRYLGGN